MTDEPLSVIGGVDCHLDQHQVVAIDQLGRRLGAAELPTTAAGYEALTTWLAGHGPVVAVGVESSGSYGAGLARHLRAAGVMVLEINQPHPHLRHRRGKSDAIDAEAAARKVLAGDVTTLPKDTTGIVESIRQMRAAREGAVKARTAALCQLGDLIVTAPAPVREHLAVRKTLTARARLCARFRPDPTKLDDPTQAARAALRSIARRIEGLNAEITDLDRQLAILVQRAAPRTLEQLGVGTHHAAQLLVTAGQNIDRLTNEAAFAHLCAADPVPASSGKTQRHRLNPGGDRNANRTLHMIVVVRLRYCPRTRAYLERRVAEGRTKREAMRCLKRYLARELYRTLLADLTSTRQPLDAL